jgi:hypothetical protein
MGDLTYCDITGSTHGSEKWKRENACYCQACYRYGNRPKEPTAALTLRNIVLEAQVKTLTRALESFRSREHSRTCSVHHDRECGPCDCGHEDTNSRIDAAIRGDE